MTPMTTPRAIAMLAAALALVLAGCGQGLDRGDAPDELRFSVLSGESRAAAESGWEPILEDMERITGYEVKADYRSDDDALIKAMRAGRIDVGRFSGRSGLEAVRSGGGEVFARATTLTDAEPPPPDDPMIYRADLDPAVKEELRQFFLTYGRGDTPRARQQRWNLEAVAIGSFEPADNTHLLPEREMEASEAVAEAQKGGDPETIGAAEAELEEIRRQRIEAAGKAGKLPLED